MKKTILTVVFVLSLTSTIVSFRKQETTKAKSPMTMVNIEALTSSTEESNWEYPDGKAVFKTCNILVTSGIWKDTFCNREYIECIGGGQGCTTSKCPVHG